MNPMQPQIQSFCGRLKPAAHPLCAFTIDVEDWFESSVDSSAPTSERVLWNMERLLTLLVDCGVKSTCFVQGHVAERFPQLVQQLATLGHDVQLHGHSHRLVYKMTEKEFRQELESGRKAVEDACGSRVTMFRAPDFSIHERNLWALGVLAEMGFEVDSSVFPLRTMRYGIHNWPIGPSLLRYPDIDKTLVEVPVASFELGGLRIPAGGGGYMRLWPRWLMAAMIRSIVRSGRPVVLYCHPYDFNALELNDFKSYISTSFRMKQGLGRASLGACVRHLFRTISFGRLDEVLQNWGVLPANQNHSMPSAFLTAGQRPSGSPLGAPEEFRI